MIDVLMPPPPYDAPYRGPLIEHVLPLEQLKALCTQMGYVPTVRGEMLYGCSKTSNGVCVIVIPKVNGWWISDQDQLLVRLHELGHCNGWPPDHSGGKQ